MINILKNENHLIFADRFYYNYDIGIVEVTECRDELYNFFISSGIKNFCYTPLYLSEDECKNIVKFIKDFQRKAKIPIKHRVRIYRFKQKNDYYGTASYVAVKLNRFWKSKLRFSLLTALLRVGTRYNGKNLISAIKTSYYFRGAPFNAVNMFLKGKINIKYVQSKNIYDLYEDEIFDDDIVGWCSYFSRVDPKKVLYRKKR